MEAGGVVSSFAKLSRRMHMLEYGKFEMEWNGLGICLEGVLVEVRPGLGQIWVGLNEFQTLEEVWETFEMEWNGFGTVGKLSKTAMDWTRLERNLAR